MYIRFLCFLETILTLKACQAELGMATKNIGDMLKRTFTKKPLDDLSWRFHPSNFPITEGELESGCVDFVASWFQSRKEVSESKVVRHHKSKPPLILSIRSCMTTSHHPKQ